MSSNLLRSKRISERRKKAVIAMKGPPFTRKTEFATLIATSLSCPALSVEDFIDFLDPTTSQPHDLGFQIICRIAKSHLLNGISDNIVIDSRLSSRSHLDQLIELVSLVQDARLVIVQCKPNNTYLWQMKFEEYIAENPDQLHNRYEPKNWDEVMEAAKQDYDERSDGYKVSKLILDPLSDYLYTFSVINIPLLLSHSRENNSTTPFTDAVKYMISHDEGDSPDVVVYNRWRQSPACLYTDESEGEGKSSQSGKAETVQKKWWKKKKKTKKKSPLIRWVDYCEDGHTITEYTKEGLEYDVNCMACEKEAKGAAYACSDCPLTLHKKCAESFTKWRYRWRNFNLIWDIFPQEFSCASCKSEGGCFSHKCASCLFESNLKCRLMPTVIRHDCEEHFLSLVLLPADAYEEVYKCLACGNLAQFSFYSCGICNIFYHIHCLTTIPVRVKHVHGGYHHHMVLKSSSRKAEDYFCDECQEWRDPELWFYSCEDCLFLAHLDCALGTKDLCESAPSNRIWLI